MSNGYRIIALITNLVHFKYRHPGRSDATVRAQSIHERFKGDDTGANNADVDLDVRPQKDISDRIGVVNVTC